MSRAPFVGIGRCHEQWHKIRATEWAIRQLRFGLQLPWKAQPQHQFVSQYELTNADLRFATG